MTRILATWTHTTAHEEVVVVPPDGCVDLIMLRPRAAQPYWFVSRLQNASKNVVLEAGLHIEGNRLRPNTLVEHNILHAATFDQVAEYLEEACRFNENVDTAIEAISRSGVTVTQTAADLGLSMRSLQRLFSENDLPSPAYWHALSRVRLAAANLCNTPNLADHAIEWGFSDQAHMTREFVRWFGITPAKFRTNQPLKAAIKQPGLAT